MQGSRILQLHDKWFFTVFKRNKAPLPCQIEGVGESSVEEMKTNNLVHCKAPRRRREEQSLKSQTNRNGLLSLFQVLYTYDSLLRNVKSEWGTDF